MENDIKIKVPEWTEDIKDEGLLTFIALLTKINYRYGCDEWYNFHRSDVNKITGGSSNIQRMLEPYHQFIEVATPYNDEFQFRMKRVFKHHLISSTLSDNRQIRIWCYLVGCMNNNLIDQEYYGARPPQSSAFTNEHEHQLFKQYGMS